MLSANDVKILQNSRATQFETLAVGSYQALDQRVLLENIALHNSLLLSFGQ